MLSIELRNLQAFGAHVHHEAEPRDPLLLNDIDETLEVLSIETGKFHTMALAAEHYVEVLLRCSTLHDENLDDLQTLFAEARDLIGAYHAEHVGKRQSAIDDGRLTSAAGVMEAYDALLEVVATLHNNLNSLAWTIGEHVADNDTVAPGSFSNADDLFAAIGV